MTRAFDFDKPRRQGRGAWVLMFLKLLRTLIKHLFPVLVVTIFRKMSWSRTLLVLAIFVGALLLIAFVLSLIRYRKLRFCVREGFLLISDHIWGRRETSIPLEKIHNIRTRSGFFYQLVEMESLQFDTLGESKAEVELLLSMEESAALRALIASATATGETTAMPTATTSDSGMASEAQSTETTQDFHYSMGQLLAGAFTQNPLRVFLVIGSVIALLYQNLDNYLIKYHEAILHKTETFVSGTSVLTLATLLFGAYLICLLLYGGKIVLQQYGLT
ncbi:PH domain-containing protein, partial [Porphyromonas loveana]|uniref:PH domain-containing protein n=1 Tax=Porphyromonas loveana TaxID=1884669 RepID=UPI00359F93AD